MNYTKEIIEVLYQLGMREQRIGQVFENIRNNVSGFKYQSNKDVLNSFIAYKNGIKPCESVREGTTEALSVLAFLLKNNISISTVIERLKEGNSDLFHYNNFDMEKKLNDIKLQFEGNKKLAPFLLSEYYFYEGLNKKDTERRSIALDLSAVAIKSNEYLTNDYHEFYSSRAYFQNTKEVLNFQEYNLREVVERVAAKIITNEQVNTMEIYILQKDFSKEGN